MAWFFIVCLLHIFFTFGQHFHTFVLFILARTLLVQRKSLNWSYYILFVSEKMFCKIRRKTIEIKPTRFIVVAQTYSCMKLISSVYFPLDKYLTYGFHMQNFYTISRAKFHQQQKSVNKNTSLHCMTSMTFLYEKYGIPLCIMKKNYVLSMKIFLWKISKGLFI